VRQWGGAQAGVFTTLAVTPTAVIAAGFGRIEAHDPRTGNLLWSRADNTTVVGRLIPIGDQTVIVGKIRVDHVAADHMRLVLRREWRTFQ
jgi:hypothetical protein